MAPGQVRLDDLPRRFAAPMSKQFSQSGAAGRLPGAGPPRLSRRVRLQAWGELGA